MRLGCIVPMAVLALFSLGPVLRADDWPQWRGLHRDGVWNGRGILETFPAGGLRIRWRVPVGPGNSSPIVADGRVYVMDCDLGPRENRRAKERVHCYDETTGRPLWTYSYDVPYPDYAWPPDSDMGGPTSTPIVQGGKLYTVGARGGHLQCFSAADGTVLWRRNLAEGFRIVEEFCIEGSPLIEGGLLILQTGYGRPGAGVLAFDTNTGREVWRALEEGGGRNYSSPLVIEAGGKRQLIVSADGHVTAFDPATGGTYWREKFSGGIPTPVCSEGRLLVNGLMFALDRGAPSASVAWPERKPNALLSDTTTALFCGDLILSHRQPNRLVCLDAKTGTSLWDAPVKSTMHSLTRCGDGVFIFTDAGDLIRARISAQGYQEISRTILVKPTKSNGKCAVVYAAPSYANRHVFARNDEELICASLAAEP